MTWKVFLHSEPWADRNVLIISRVTSGGEMAFMQTPTLEVTEEGEYVDPDKYGIRLNGVERDDFLRAMANAAWDAGIKPTALEDHTNELKAVRYHLEDMRTLAKVNK